MEATKVLLPAHEMTTAQCVMECSDYLRTIANQEFEGEDWQTAPKLRRQNLLTDFLCNLELSGKEFAELCGLIGFQLSKTTTAKLAKFTVIAYDWQSEANGEATADILEALDKCEGVTLIEERGYRPQARTYDYLRFHIAAFWRCLVNELRSLCLGIGLVVRPKEIPATPAETPQISTETAETVNVSAEGENAENEPQKHISEVLKEAERNYQCVKSETLRTVREADGKWHTYFMDEEIGIDLAYDQINHIPAARAAQAAEEVAEIRRYMNRLNGNHIADADYYLAEMREGIKQAEAARRKKNADTEGENKAERAKYRVSRFGGYKIIVGDREQGKVIAVLMAVNGHNVIEINDESAHIATMGEKPLQMDKPITQLSDAEVLGLIYGYIEPPQSPETPQTVECTADTPKPRETARKLPNRAIGYMRATQRDTLRNTLRSVTCVPRECSTADASYW